MEECDPILESLDHPNRAAQYPLYASLCTGELNAIRKQNAFSAILSAERRVGGPCLGAFKGPEMNGSAGAQAQMISCLSIPKWGARKRRCECVSKHQRTKARLESFRSSDLVLGIGKMRRSSLNKSECSEYSDSSMDIR